MVSSSASLRGQLISIHYAGNGIDTSCRATLLIHDPDVDSRRWGVGSGFRSGSGIKRGSLWVLFLSDGGTWRAGSGKVLATDSSKVELKSKAEVECSAGRDCPPAAPSPC